MWRNLKVLYSLEGFSDGHFTIYHYSETNKRKLENMYNIILKSTIFYVAKL